MEGTRKTAGHSTERQGWRRWRVDEKRGADGDWVTWRSTRSRGDDDEEGETEDQLSHRCKYDGEHRCARVRVETLTGTTKKKTKKKQEANRSGAREAEG
jgi:hypothetical protein